MNLEEKIKFIVESKGKHYLVISPEFIGEGLPLFTTCKGLKLYENMEENTKKFAEEKIVNLISEAQYKDKEEKDELIFKLFFCGGHDDYHGIPIDFIMKNKEKIVARCVQSKKNVYLSLGKLLDEFEKYNIKYKIINTPKDRSLPPKYRDIETTRFIISYNPKKEIEDEIEDEKGHQLKKVR